MTKKERIKRASGRRSAAGGPPGIGFPFGPAAEGAEHLTDVAHGPAMAFNVGADGTILYVHRSLPGVRGDDLCGTSIISHTAPDQKHVVEAAIARVFESGEAQDYECRGFLPFTEDPWYYCRMAPNKHEDTVVSATLVLQDITRWKRAEEELRQERDEALSERDRDKRQLEQLSQDVARLTATLLERDRERKQARTRSGRNEQEAQHLTTEVSRLQSVLGERDRELELERALTAKDRLTVTTKIAEHATVRKQAEAELERERAEYEEEVARLSAELAMQAYLQDRQNRDGKRFRKILDQAGEAVFIIDPETGRFVDANETGCRWLGYDHAKLVTLRAADLDLEFPVDATDELEEHVVETRKRARPRVLRGGRLRRRNGTAFAVEVAIARGRAGGRDYNLVVARDTNSRRRIEEALAEAEENYRSLFNYSRDGIYLSQRDGKVAEVNDAALELFGYSREEFLGLEAKKLYRRAADIRGFQAAVAEHGFVQDMDVELRAKDGTPIPALLTATLRHSGDESVLGYQCVIRPLPRSGRSPTGEVTK